MTSTPARARTDPAADPAAEPGGPAASATSALARQARARTLVLPERQRSVDRAVGGSRRRCRESRALLEGALGPEGGVRRARRGPPESPG